MSTTMFSKARVLALPGIQAQLTFDPSQVSVRLRNSARKMLESGVVGGYSSIAAKIARMVAAQVGYDLRGAGSGNYVTPPRGMPEPLRRQIYELWQASLVAHKIAGNRPYGWPETHASNFLEQRTQDDYLYFYDADNRHDLAQQARRIITNFIAQQTKARKEQALALLDSPQPVPITVGIN